MSVMVLPELLILRHGETEWNREGRIQGQKDSPLTAKGRDQARDQGAILSRLDLTGWSARVSPQKRAQDTASLALEGVGIMPEVDPRLREIEAGEWAGRLSRDIRLEWAYLFESGDEFDWIDHAPGGERFDALEARCRALLDDLSGPTILICHGITSRMLRVLALGRRGDGLSAVPGGQGNVHHLKDGQHDTLSRN